MDRNDRDMEAFIRLAEAESLVEREQDWRGWFDKIPAIHFPSEWAVKVIPPFGGALVRFMVNDRVSVYFDGYSRLGYHDGPYWEVYPYDDDVWRCDMDDVTGLLSAIQRSLDKEVVDDCA